MKQLVNPATIRPVDIKEDMVMVVTVTCHIIQGRDGLTYRLYRCPYPSPQTAGGIPQGDRIYTNPDEVIDALFPAVHWADIKEDY